MSLQPLDIVNGVFGTLVVVISIVVGIVITSKYFKTKNNNFLYVGLTWILLASGWYGTTASFFVALITGSDGLSFQMILLLNFIPLPFGLFCWLLAFTNFLYKEKKKYFLIIYGIISIFYYITFLYVVFTDPSIIGYKISPVDTSGNFSFLLLYIVFFVLVLLITGIKFAIETIKLDDPEMKLKGKLLLVAFPSFVIGALLDAIFPTTAITLVIFRLILISSAVEFYLAFIMPDWMKKRLKSVNNN